jgi:hypothetical protein
MDIPILNGIYADQAADFRTSYPRNMVPVPKGQGISKGYLRPADGITLVGTGPGTDRGGFNWNGVCYRVMGTKLVSVSSAGAVTELGDVGSGAQVTIDNGFDRLAIWSGGRLYYWNGSGAHAGDRPGSRHGHRWPVDRRLLHVHRRHEPHRHRPERPDVGQPAEVRQFAKLIRIRSSPSTSCATRRMR